MAEGTKLVWEKLHSTRADAGMLAMGWEVHRTKVPGGWLVMLIQNTTGITFYPDPEHRWDGGSLA